MRRLMLATLLVLVGVTVVGCAGVGAYKPVNLKGNLGPGTIRRYEEAYKKQRAAGKAGGMSMHNVGMMHVAMIHKSDALLPSGRWEKASSIGLAMHIVNIHKMGGHTYVSLFTAPNAVGLDVTGGY